MTPRHVTMCMHRLGALGALTFIVAVVALATATRAGAEAGSTRIIVSWVPQVSSFGPETANGVVAYSLTEGDVRADLIGLPVLGDSERYELWLLNSSSGETFSLARFNASEDGVTFIDKLLPEAIPDYGWDQAMVTVEPDPDTSASASGTIALIGPVPGTPAEIQQLPEVLPETGEAQSRDASPVVALLLAGAGGLGLVAHWRARRARLVARPFRQEER